MATSYQNIVSEEVDCSSIFNVDNLTNSINGELSRIVSSLVELYGYTDEEQDKYKSTFLSGVRDVVIQYIQKAVQEVEDTKERAIINIQDMETRIYELTRVMDYAMDGFWLDDYGRDMREGKPLVEVEKIVKQVLDGIEQKYSAQHTAVKQKLDELKRYYAILGLSVEEEFMSVEDNMTPERVDIIENRLKDSITCMNNRRVCVQQQAEEILNCCKFLGITYDNAENEIDRLVISGAELPICAENIEQYGNRIKDLSELQAARKDEILALSKQIDILWALLGISEEDAKDFINHCSASCADDIYEYYNNYLQRLIALFKEKLNELIPSLRENILALFTEISSVSHVTNNYDIAILDIPEEQFSQELYHQHEELYNELLREKEALDPFLNRYNQLLEFRAMELECERIKQTPNLYSGKRETQKLVNRMTSLEKQLKTKPTVIKELIETINAYEREHAEIYVENEHFVEKLSEEYNKIRPRSTVSVYRGPPSHGRS